MDHPNPTVGASESLDLGQFAKAPLSTVRRWVADMLVGTPEDCRDDAVLLVNELVSNVFDHATPPCQVRVRPIPAQQIIRVEVDDGETNRMPVMGTSRIGSSRGRGLIMVDRLARRWGVVRRTLGKTVWAEIPCPAMTLLRPNVL